MPPRRGYVTNKKIDPKSLLRLLKYVFFRYKVQLACVGICLIVSSLVETEEQTAVTEEFSVASNSTDFNIDLGYVLRNPGAYPAGYGEQETMDWSKAYEGVVLK